MGYSFAPFWCLCQKLSLSPLYFNKTLLHKSSEQSSLICSPGLNSSPPEAKNPASYRSATTFHLGGSSGILQDKMGLIIYVSLLLLTPEILSLPFDPQDNAFLSWAHSYAAFHNRSNCWVYGTLPSSSVKGIPWWTSPLQGKDFLQVCKYLPQSHVMPLLKLRTSNNLNMDWCNYGHNVTFHFDFNLV